MPNSGLTPDDLSSIIAELKKRPEIEEAVLYGSRAIGTFKPGSDVDLAIKGKNVTHDICTALHFSLEEESPLPYFFDVTDYNSIQNQQLKEHIDRFGHIIYIRGSSEKIQK